MSEHEDLAPLDEMAEAAGRIDTYLVDVSRDQFLSTPLLKDAVSLNLIVIGGSGAQGVTINERRPSERRVAGAPTPPQSDRSRIRQH